MHISLGNMGLKVIEGGGQSSKQKHLLLFSLIDGVVKKGEIHGKLPKDPASVKQIETIDILSRLKRKNERT